MEVSFASLHIFKNGHDLTSSLDVMYMVILSLMFALLKSATWQAIFLRVGTHGLNTRGSVTGVSGDASSTAPSIPMKSCGGI